MQLGYVLKVLFESIPWYVVFSRSSCTHELLCSKLNMFTAGRLTMARTCWGTLWHHILSHGWFHVVIRCLGCGLLSAHNAPGWIRGNCATLRANYEDPERESSIYGMDITWTLHGHYMDITWTLHGHSQDVTNVTKWEFDSGWTRMEQMVDQAWCKRFFSHIQIYPGRPGLVCISTKPFNWGPAQPCRCHVDVMYTSQAPGHVARTSLYAEENSGLLRGRLIQAFIRTHLGTTTC